MLPSPAGLSPDERRGMTAAFLTTFGALFAHTLLETARDALFLTRLPASHLPGVYLVIALVAVGLSQAPWARRRVGGTYGLSQLLATAAAVTFLLWLIGPWQSPPGLYALYVWTGIIGSLVVLQFWMVLADLYTITQAKRIYQVVGTGSLLGAAVGGATARAISAQAPVTWLVLVAALAFAATAIGPAIALGRTARRTAPAPGGGLSMASAMRTLRADPYVRGLAGLVLVSTVALTLGDYVFKSAVARQIPPGELGTFFAGVYAVLNLLALAAQVLLTGWLFRVLGLHRALWVLPMLLFLGAAGVALGGGLAAALLLRGADGALRNSLDRTGRELLFVPLSNGLRARAKPLIDLVGQRGGQALASLFILAEVPLHRGDTVVAAAAAALAVIWVAWVVDLRSHYLDLFRSALREGAIRPAVDLPPVDLGSLEALITSLNSADDGEVLAAVELLAEEGRTRLIPALILHHPSSAVVGRTLELFARDGRSDFLPVADRLRRHPDPEIRSAALRARARVRPEEGPLRAALDDPSPLVRATAVAGLVAGGWGGEETARLLEEVVERGSPESQTALARAIAELPTAAFEAALLRLADSSADEVAVPAAQAMGALARSSFLPALLRMLDRHELRPAARDALVAFGDGALVFLDDALGDHALPAELRRHLPRTISAFASPGAAAVLQRHLLDEPDGAVRYRIIRGLNRLAARPDVDVDGGMLDPATEATLRGLFRLVHWRGVLERETAGDPRRVTPGHELLVQLLRDKETHAMERLSRLLALRYRGEDMKGVYRGLRSGDPRLRASSRELLEHLLAPPLRGAVLALVEEIPDPERLARATPFYAPPVLDYEGVLAVLLDEGGESLRCIAAHHAGELRLQALRPRLEGLRSPEAGFFLQRVVGRALEALATEGEAAAHA